MTYWDHYQNFFTDGPLGWLGSCRGIGVLFGIMMFCLASGNGEMSDSAILGSGAASVAILFATIIIIMRWFGEGITEKGRNSGVLCNALMTGLAFFLAAYFSLFVWTHMMLVALQVL